MKLRNRKIVVYAGMPGCGKTTDILKTINAFLKQHPKEKVIIYDINREKAYAHFPAIDVDKIPFVKSGVYRIVSSDYEGVLKALSETFRNGLVVLEDANYYLTAARNMTLWQILVSRRHMGMDVILTFHSLARVPPYLYEMLNVICLFKTNENVDRVKSKIPNFDKVEKIKNKINKHPNKYYHEVIVQM